MVKNKTVRRLPARTRHHYRVYNLSVVSTLPLPELQGIAPKAAEVSIREGRVPERLVPDQIQKEGWFFENHLYYQIAGNHILLDIIEVGRFLIKNKSNIIIQRRPGVSDDELRLYLLGSGFGILLLSRGMFAFHGSAVCNPKGECILFIGESGVGKSTTAAKFIQRGYQLLADDISLVSFSRGEVPTVFPALPQLKVWRDSAKALGFDRPSLRLILPDWEKYRVNVSNSFSAHPAGLAAIYEICVSDVPQLLIRPLDGMEKFLSLSSNIYRGLAVELLNLNEEHFTFCTRLAGGVPIFRLDRPEGNFQLSALTDLIEQNTFSPG